MLVPLSLTRTEVSAEPAAFTAPLLILPQQRQWPAWQKKNQFLAPLFVDAYRGQRAGGRTRWPLYGAASFSTSAAAFVIAAQSSEAEITTA